MTRLAVLAFAFLGTIAFAQTPATKPPEELERMRHDYQLRRAAALKPINAAYLAQLEMLQKKLTFANNLEGALIVKKEMESLRESSAQEGQDDLLKALVQNKWLWIGAPGDSGVATTFKEDGSVNHVGLRGTWRISGVREITIRDSSNSGTAVLTFDPALKEFTQVNGKVRGRRM